MRYARGMPLIRQVVVPVRNADPEPLDDEETLSCLLNEAAQTAGATVLDHGKHKFTPQGVTCYVFALLAESHAWIHTWPEENSYVVEASTCGDRVDPLEVVELVLATLGGEYDPPEVVEIG